MIGETPDFGNESNEIADAKDLATRVTQQMEADTLSGKKMDKDLWKMNVKLKKLLEVRGLRDQGKSIEDSGSKMSNEELVEEIKEAEKSLKEYLNNSIEIPPENSEAVNSEKESLPKFRRGDKIKLTPETVESWKRASLIGELSPTEGVVTDAKDDEQMAMIQVGYKTIAVSYKDIERGEALERVETLKKGTRVRLTQEAVDRLEDSGMIEGFPATEGIVSTANDEGQIAAVKFKDRFKEASSVRQISYKDLEKLGE